MKNRLRICAFVLTALMTFTGCNSSMTELAKETKTPPGSSLDARIRRFAPTEITADISHLSEGDRKALTKIIEAAKLLDPLFLRQVWSGNEALQKKLAADTSPEGKARLRYFRINVGPWSRLDNKEPFIDGAPREKPKNANFYPDDMTKEEAAGFIFARGCPAYSPAVSARRRRRAFFDRGGRDIDAFLCDVINIMTAPQIFQPNNSPRIQRYRL